MSHLPAGYPRNVLVLMAYIQEKELLFKPLFIPCTPILHCSNKGPMSRCGSRQQTHHGWALQSYIVKGVNTENSKELGSLMLSIPPMTISVPSEYLLDQYFLECLIIVPRAFFQTHILANFEAHGQWQLYRDHCLLFHDCNINFNQKCGSMKNTHVKINKIRQYNTP